MRILNALLAGGFQLSVKVLIEAPDSSVLLVRHRYGSGRWMLPGGGLKNGESVRGAAVREVDEELGRAISEAAARPSVLGVFHDVDAGPASHVVLLHMRLERRPEPSPSPLEIAAAEWFAMSALPSNTSPATQQRIDELVGAVAQIDTWRPR